tara:strand:+ start:225 stop:578 length:354 start_codon:yes stop_codon:yes gene_type:complete
MEPLLNILSIYKDKQKVLLHYLPDETTHKLDNHEYVINLETLFLNDRLILVKRQTGKIHKCGSIIRLTDERITIKDKNTRSNISLMKQDYYLFRYIRKNNSHKNNRLFYEELLNNLS